MGIENLDLSARAYLLLKRNYINTIEQLENINDNDLMNVRNMGKKTFAEIKQKLNEFHITMNRCEFCKDLDNIYEIVCYILTNNGSAIDIPINFCPNCGSKIDN